MEPAQVMSKVYNLTDVSTPTLVQYGLVEQSIAVGGRMIAPGEYAECQNNGGHLMLILEHLLTVGAVSVDKVPPPYVKARAQKDAEAGGKPSNAPAHLAMSETKITDAGPQVPVLEVPPVKPSDAAPEESKVDSKRSR